MARYKRGAKTQAIRDYLAAHPDASPKEVVEGLKTTTGMSVKLSLVSVLKYSKRKAGKRRRGRAMTMSTAARRTISNGSSLSFEQLVEVKRLSDSLGGSERVRETLDALAQLQ
jgi:hypothetical protein